MKMKTLLLLLFLVGLASFSCFFLIPERPRWLVLVGWLMCLSAYIGMLSMFYKRKVPVNVLFHRVDKDKRPVLYNLFVPALCGCFCRDGIVVD